MSTIALICFSPSVLDRLNALLEPGGVLTIDERGVIDGQIPSIKPHPNFRLYDFCYTNSVISSIMNLQRTLLKYNIDMEVLLVLYSNQIQDSETSNSASNSMNFNFPSG